MLKSCVRWLMRSVGHQSRRGTVIFVVVSGALMRDSTGHNRDASSCSGRRVKRCIGDDEREFHDD